MGLGLATYKAGYRSGFENDIIIIRTQAQQRWNVTNQSVLESKHKATTVKKKAYQWQHRGDWGVFTFLHFSLKHLLKLLQNIWLSRSWQQRHKQKVGHISAKLSALISIAYWLDKTSLYLCAAYPAWCTCLKWSSYLNDSLSFPALPQRFAKCYFFLSVYIKYLNDHFRFKKSKCTDIIKGSMADKWNF